MRAAIPRRPTFEGLEGRVVCSGIDVTVRRPSAESGSLHARAVAMDRLSNVVYTNGTTAPQVLDVYRPAGPAPPGGWPVVLAIHGGGWRKYSKEQYASKVAPPLVGQGFAVVAPNYTLSRPGSPTWPAPLQELRQAVRWVRANAAALNFNASQVAAMGESAGAHLALLLGTAAPGPATRVGAVVDFFGPTDLATLRVQSPGARFAIDQLLGPAATDPSTLAGASPVRRVSPDDAPVLIVHGTADTLVPPAQAGALASALSAARVPNTLMLIPGGTHGFGFNVGGRSLLPSIVAFLRRSLQITG